jgi:hypothetical protein
MNRSRVRRLAICGRPGCHRIVPPDGIRLKGGIYFCPTGDCRQYAESLIRRAWQAAAAQRLAEVSRRVREGLDLEPKGAVHECSLPT